jgi:hypothetical protein
MVQRKQWEKWWVFACFSVCYVIVFPASALESSNYRIDESAISTGNLLQSSSANYQALDGINDLAIGTSASSNYQVLAGSKTDPYPWLTFRINSTNTDFGTLSSATTATGTASFTVLNYTSYGYNVQITGTPPANSGHSISAMGIKGTSQTGIEQFGINLVANTAPTSLGANPNNGLFGFGTVTSNYSTTNNYYYSNGDTIAQSPKSSGETTYTISFILNVAPLTPGGQYASGQALVVTGTY